MACAAASVRPDTHLARLLNASWDESHFPLPPTPAPPLHSHAATRPQVKDRTCNRPSQCPAGSLFRGAGPCCRGVTTRNWRSTHQTSGPTAALTGRDGTGACQGHVRGAEELRMGPDGMAEAGTRRRQDLIGAGRHAEKTQQEVHGTDGARFRAARSQGTPGSPPVCLLDVPGSPYEERSLLLRREGSRTNKSPNPTPESVVLHLQPLQKPPAASQHRTFSVLRPRLHQGGKSNG